MKDSCDLLTKHNLLTEECDVERTRCSSRISLGTFKKDKYPELFKDIVYVFDLNEKRQKVYLELINVEYFDFFDVESDEVNLLNADAPLLCCDWKYVSLSKKDAVLLSKFLIKEHMEIIKDLERVEEELMR